MEPTQKPQGRSTGETYYTDTKAFFSRMMDKAEKAEVTARDGIMAAVSLSYLTGERPIPGVTNHINIQVSLPELIKQAASVRRNRVTQSLAH